MTRKSNLPLDDEAIWGEPQHRQPLIDDCPLADDGYCPTSCNECICYLYELSISPLSLVQ